MGCDEKRGLTVLMCYNFGRETKVILEAYMILLF
jgi:hypothetical protein